MNRRFYSFLRQWWHTYAVASVLVFWVVGLFAGAFCVFWGYEHYAAIMRTVAVTEATVMGLFFLGAIPLLLSYLAVRLSLAPLMLLPVFVKAFCFAFCSFGVLWSYGNAGWLMRALLLFSDSVWVVILLFFWLRNATGSRKVITRDLLMCMASAGTVVLIDYLYMVPLLHSIL